jgi:hypothetical protein
MTKLGKGSNKGESPFLRVRITLVMLDTLRRLAVEDRRTLSDYVRLALEDHIANVQKRAKKGGR